MPTGGKQNSKEVLEFLGGLGSSDRGDNVKLGHTAQALVELGSFLIQEATEGMQAKGNIATGKTAESMHLANLDTRTTKMSVDVQILSTYKFLDRGVNGTEQNVGGKYSFKTPYPNKKMATAILKWLRTRSLAGKTKYKSNTGSGGSNQRTKGTFSSKGFVEEKSKRINQLVQNANNYKSLAYAVSTAIKKKGIRPTKFFTNAVKKTKDLQKKKYAAAFKLDIIENLS